MNLATTVIRKKSRETTKDYHVLKSEVAQLIEKLAHDPNVEGLNQASPGIRENCGITKCPHILTTAVAQLIEKLTNDLNFKGLNKATPGIGEIYGGTKGVLRVGQWWWHSW